MNDKILKLLEILYWIDWEEKEYFIWIIWDLSSFDKEIMLKSLFNRLTAEEKSKNKLELNLNMLTNDISELEDKKDLDDIEFNY